MNAMKAPKIWVVAAGTGGHIFPGLNIVAQMKKQYPNANFCFFGDPSRLEAKLIPAHGYKITYLAAGRWKGTGLLAKLGGIFSIVQGFFQALLKTFSEKPDLLLSIGGYVSVPVAMACIVRGVPFFIMEGNIRAGVANRLLSRFAKAVFTTAGSDAPQVMKALTFEYGNPVRKDLRPIEIRPQVKRVLVLGGSQGALSLCRLSLEVFRDLDLGSKGIALFVQTGEKNFEQTKEWAAEFNIDAWVQTAPFINDVPKALCEADVIVARAGMMTVAELAQAGAPTIFIPYPHAADNHQAVNAKLLVEAGAALMVDETKGGSIDELKTYVAQLCLGESSYSKRQKLSEAFRKWSKPHAAEDIVQKMAELAKL